MKDLSECPNCYELHDASEAGLPEVCMLEAFLGMAAANCTSKEKLQELLVLCNVDAFWEDVGRICDKLENGEYSI